LLPWLLFTTPAPAQEKAPSDQDIANQLAAIVKEIKGLRADLRPSGAAAPSPTPAQIFQAIYPSAFVYIPASGGTNAVIVIPAGENVETIRDVVNRLYPAAGPGALAGSSATKPELEVFPLKYVDAEKAGKMLQALYKEADGVRVVAHVETSSLVVRAFPEDLERIKRLLEKLYTREKIPPPVK
jgi:type II secretory pathway component GspD/PulD (secretin)